MALHRLARPAPAWWNVIKTVLAIALFSIAMTWAVPLLIVRLQHASGLTDWFIPAQKQLGEVLFGLGSALIVLSALTLAVRGGGTPLPFDAPRKLVVTGPYAWFRNPMVVGLTLQGCGAGAYTGSVVILAYFGMLAMGWEVMLRRAEESQLQRTFGKEFETYCRSVRCWLPMRKRWQPPAKTGPITLDDLPQAPYRRRSRR